MHDLRKFTTLTLDLCCKAVEVGAIRQRLSVSEFATLELLTRRPGALFAREQLLDAIFGDSAGYYSDRTIDSHVKRLRKLGVPGLMTHYGTGYFWEDRITTTGPHTRLRTLITPRCCDYCGAPILSK